ncbi:MAG: glycosyltransferase [Bacteroidia bacterium]
MESKTLHIVVFDVPFPANYGGVIDIYYKIRALHHSGIKIILHCFVYGKRLPQSVELLKYCSKIFYYKRKQTYNSFSFLPYIIYSRKNKQLLENLAQDNSPILFEGLHTCAYLNHKELKHKKKFVRTHNIEHEYYRHLFLAEPNFFKKLYFLFESVLLAYFERTLKNANYIFAITEKDTKYFYNKYKNALHLPVFSGNLWQENNTDLKSKKYALYHGKLSVAENNEAAAFLVQQVFSKLKHQLIIAGDNPSKQLIKLCQKINNVKIVSVQNETTIQDLIQKAHIHVLPTFQQTGIKLKLLNALYSKGFCIVNSNMVTGTKLEPVCNICNTSEEWIKAINDCMQKEITIEDLMLRKFILNDNFCDAQNIKILTETVY